MLKEQILERSGGRDNSLTKGRGSSMLDKEEGEVEIMIRKPFFEKYKGGIQAYDGKRVYFFGIIDLFTNYG